MFQSQKKGKCHFLTKTINPLNSEFFKVTNRTYCDASINMYIAVIAYIFILILDEI